ncbi:MAG: tetratricopeptide repeat protein [Pyrinomonadaceae bacterium]
MVFEKAKVLKAAEKFLSQGKISAAIKEYRQIVEHDEDDLTTLNMLGDLCARAGQHDEAIACFSKIAEHYREQEFTLKAIAMYKKIERLKPHDPAIAAKLAALYATQGLAADARHHYLIVADAFTRAGRTKQTLEVLHRVADLDPNNTDIRLKLAEGYLKEGLNVEAAQAFSEAAARLSEAGQSEKALSAFTKALEFRPNDETALRGIIGAHVAMGSADEAAELLERIIAERPDEPELVSMLASAYIAAEDPKGAERATATIVAHDATNYGRFMEVVQLYLKNGAIDDATRILAGITEQLLAGREENELLELVREILAQNPEHVEALRLLVRIHWWQRDMDNLRAALERLAEAAAAANMTEDERYALTQLVRLAPDERYSARLAELGGAQETEESAFTSQPSISEVPSFESFAIVGEEAAAAQPEEGSSTAAMEFEWNSVSEQPAPEPSGVSFADLSEESAVASDPEVSRVESSVEGFELSSGALGEGVGAPSTGEPPVDQANAESLIRQELESVDFYITQGYADIAVDTLDLMERQFGHHPEIAARRERLKAGLSAGGQEAASPAPSPETLTATDDLSDLGATASSRDGKGIDAGLAEIFEEFRAAAEEEPVAQEDFETHYNMGTAYKEMDLVDEAIQEFQTAASLTKPGDGTSKYLQCCNMLGHCFLQKGMPRAALPWFKKGLETTGAHEDEYKALRYELGLAYEQLGDLTRALEMFTEVYSVDVSYRGVADKLREIEEQKKVKKRRK